MNLFEIVKYGVSCREAAERYGVEVNHYGMALCPFHNDRHPSLYVADDHYYCFACGEHGDVIDFVSKLFHLSLYDAAQKLAADFHLTPDKPPSAAALHAKRIRTEAQQLRETEQLCFSVLSDYAHVLRDWKVQYAPQSPAEAPDERFVEACHKLDEVEYYQSQLYVRFLCFGNGALTALHDKSDGFFRRQIVLTTKDRPAGRADDPFLVDKLLREKEGIFLWCLEGLHRLIGNDYQFTVSSKAKENMETVKRSSNNVIEFLQSEGYIRFRADSEASSKAIYEAYTRWCDDNAQKPMSANRVSSELAQNERLYNVESTNNVHVGGKRVRGFVGIEVVNPLPY